jgi:hypothetical protein
MKMVFALTVAYQCCLKIESTSLGIKLNATLCTLLHEKLTRDGTEAIEIIRKEGLSFPVRALSSLLMIFVLTPTLEFHSDC